MKLTVIKMHKNTDIHYRTHLNLIRRDVSYLFSNVKVGGTEYLKAMTCKPL